MTVTLVIIIITGLISWQAFNNRDLFAKWLHSPYQESRNKELHRLLTSMFLHGSPTHLLINLFVLYQFGTAVEGRFIQLFGATMGMINFFLLYMLSGIFANTFTFLKHKDNQVFSSVGASGAVSGIMMAYVIFAPWNWLLLFFIIPLPAFGAALAYLIYSTWASNHSNDMVDHDAHLHGALFGIAFTLLLKPSLFSQFIEQLMLPTPPPFF